MLVGHGCKCFVSALYNTLAANVYPTPCCHLSIHHQAFLFQFGKMFPCGPFGNQLRIAEQYTWGIFMCLQYAYGFAALYQ